MNKKISMLLTGILTVSCVSGCTGQTTSGQASSGQGSSAAASVSEQEPAVSDFSGGTPWICSILEGVVTEDTETNLKDDYFLAVNKEAILSTEILPGRSKGGLLYEVAAMLDEDLKNMFLQGTPSSHDEKLAYDLFQLMMDWESRNKLGTDPLKEKTDLIEAVTSLDELTAYFTGTPYVQKDVSLFTTACKPNLDDNEHNILYIDNAQLVLDDSAEYASLTDYGQIIKNAYTELVKKVLVKAGYTEEEAAGKMENCLAFETLMAPAIYTSEEANKPDYQARINNHMTRDELKTAEGNVPILEELEQSIGYPEYADYIVCSPAYLEKLNALYTEENLPLIKDYLIVQTVISNAGTLDRECYEWDYECRNEITGAASMLDDATAFSGSVSELLPWPVAQMYTSTYLKAEDKARLTEFTNEILEEYHEIILNADFLSEETKAKAIEKLEAINPHILYADDWAPYSCATLNFKGPDEGGTLTEALASIQAYNRDKVIKDSLKPIDKSLWLVTPTWFNCAYHHQSNSIYILGSFARGKVYDSEMSDEELYGKMGFVIGHEISHAFDSRGAQFDKYGNMANWWTDEDLAAFQAKNEKLVEYFNQMHPWEGQNFYGSIMTGEACADMAGIKCMLSLAKKKKDFDYDKFFRSASGVWLAKITLQAAYSSINDPHPLAYLRVNGVFQQYDDFLELYGIKEGDGMYLAPEDRVNIW